MNTGFSALASVLLLTATVGAQSFPKLTPFAQNLDILVVDTTLDGVWRLMDLNQDGDFNDVGEVVTFYDDAQGTIVLSNPACIAVGPEGTAYIADTTEDFVLALRDLNSDGDALDANEHWVFFDGALNGSGIVMTSSQGITVDANGVVLVSHSSTGAGGDDAILRLADGNGNRDANDSGEATSYGIVQANGAGAVGDSIPTKVRVGPFGDLFFTEVGSTGVFTKGIYQMQDVIIPNGNCNDPGEITPYWIPSLGGNPFFWAFEVTLDGTIYLTDHGGERIWRARDISGDGQIQSGTAEEELYYQIPGGSTMWDVLVREDGAIIVCEDEAPDRLAIYQDLDSSGTIDQANEIGAVYDSSVAVVNNVRPRGAAFLRRPTLTATPNPVRLGQLVRLDFFGAPGNPLALYAGTAFPSIPLPPFGELALDPQSMIFVTSAQLDAQGNIALLFNIPTDPTLIGDVPLQTFEFDLFRPQLSRRLEVSIRP